MVIDALVVTVLSEAGVVVVCRNGEIVWSAWEEEMVLVKEGVVRKAFMTVSCQDLAALDKWCGDPSVLTDS